MIEIQFPTPKHHRFQMKAEERFVRGQKSESIVDQSWIELSEVMSHTIKIDDVKTDPELLSYYKTTAEHFRFDLVRLGCTFKSGEQESFDKAWLSAPMLSNKEDKLLPIVWAMNPEQIYDTVEINNSVKIGAEFKFISSEANREYKTLHKEHFLRAYREGKGAPLWEFCKTKTTSIEGSFILTMIVRVPKTLCVEGKVNVAGIIGKTKFLLIKTKHRLEDLPSLTFQLKPT